MCTDICVCTTYVAYVRVVHCVYSKQEQYMTYLTTSYALMSSSTLYSWHRNDCFILTRGFCVKFFCDSEVPLHHSSDCKLCIKQKQHTVTINFNHEIGPAIAKSNNMRYDLWHLPCIAIVQDNITSDKGYSALSGCSISFKKQAVPAHPSNKL